MTPEQVRSRLREELRPIALKNCTLGRLGGENDGGYLVCENLLKGVASAYSYGDGAEDEFSCDVSARYHVPVTRYNCSGTGRDVCERGKFTIHNACVGSRSSADRHVGTLADQIAANGDTAKRLLVTMDVEGAEWDALMATPDSVLERIDQMPIEFHGVNESRFLEVILKLKRQFHLVNVNFNNFSCTPDAAPLPGWAYQVLLVNKRLGEVDAGAPVPALRSDLNAPDFPQGPDCQLLEEQDLARERALHQALFAELQPVALKNCRLSRVGSPNDGGYLMCLNLTPRIDAAYSYGIGPNDDWGCEVSTRYKVTTHQYDCFDPARPVCKTGRFEFHNQCISSTREKRLEREFDTLAAQIDANGDAGKRLLLKIDVEGAEWEALMATPDAVLDQFDQIAMELHGLNRERYLTVVRRLKQHFYVVNLHANNHGCSADVAPFSSTANQVLLVNKRIGVLDAQAPVPAPPSPLNARDNSDLPDCAPAKG